ncbi:AGAP004123-PA-like protein [Anopheles sinensis]|uniref:AGAP004123-PA-like protein n=1 Tax=Anopheles sinensis TaxID=74873 RepID=A0A084VL74_ANOSI|nr:AGAP004123-PA-like protein [Anopheles sinensis]
MESVLTRFNLTLDNMTTLSSNIRQGLIEQYSNNRKVGDPWYHILIVMYGTLIVFGATGNSLVVLAVARKPQMRTARNMFIVNLAVSDLLLCLVTMPLTLVEILTKYWPLGRLPFLCKSIGTLQATSIFVSTISITAIALDRYQVIVYPTRDSLQLMGAIAILTGIWIISIVLASPMFITHQLIHYDVNLPSLGIEYVSYCVEEWPIAYGRVYYSAFTLCVQYFLPILIVSVAYLRIYLKLKHRLVVSAGPSSSAGRGKGTSRKDTQPVRERERGRRMQRTNYLLISIALIFGVSWLPLNLFNLFADIYVKAITEDIMVAYAICHMVGMSSACSNPLLYGWLNDNFRKEFNELLCRTPPSGASAGGGGGLGGGHSYGGSRANGAGPNGDRRSGGGNGRLEGNGGPTNGRAAAAAAAEAEATTQVRDHYGAAMLQDSGVTENGDHTELTELMP